VPHTSKFVPWLLCIYTAFSDKTKAFAFKRYLKSGSGSAVAKDTFDVGAGGPTQIPSAAA
jgi:hypothetical protein